jgi:hypothetical protein
MLVRRRFAGRSASVAIIVCIAYSMACNEPERSDMGSGASKPAAAGSARSTELNRDAENEVGGSVSGAGALRADAAGRGGSAAIIAVPDGSEARDAGAVPVDCAGSSSPEVLVPSGVNGMHIALTEKDVYWSSSQVFRTPKGGGSSEVVKGTTVGGRGPFIDSNRLYWGGRVVDRLRHAARHSERDPDAARDPHR